MLTKKIYTTSSSSGDLQILTTSSSSDRVSVKTTTSSSGSILLRTSARMMNKRLVSTAAAEKLTGRLVLKTQSATYSEPARRLKFSTTSSSSVKKEIRTESVYYLRGRLKINTKSAEKVSGKLRLLTETGDSLRGRLKVLTRTEYIDVIEVAEEVSVRLLGSSAEPLLATRQLNLKPLAGREIHFEELSISEELSRAGKRLTLVTKSREDTKALKKALLSRQLLEFSSASLSELFVVTEVDDSGESTVVYGSSPIIALASSKRKEHGEGKLELLSETLQRVDISVDLQANDVLIDSSDLAARELTDTEFLRALADELGCVLIADDRGESVVFRERYTEAPSESVPTHQMTLILKQQEKTTPPENADAVTVISDVPGSSMAPAVSLEVLDGSGPFEKVLKIYSSRPILGEIYSSDDTSVKYVFSDRVEETRTEDVEFIAGSASLSKPCKTLLSVSWKKRDLGAAELVDDRTLKTSDVSGDLAYSLATVEYTTIAETWRLVFSREGDFQLVKLLEEEL